jgi:uncharacterized damage-inducible protein DinB
MPSGDFAALTRLRRASDRRLIDLVRGLGAARLSEPVRIVDEAGQPWSDPLHRVLAHLFAHQVHHRGQVHDLLSQTAVSPPQLDEFYLSQDAAGRAEEMQYLGLADASGLGQA